MHVTQNFNALTTVRALTAAIALALPFSASNAMTQLDDINVTATRTAQTVDDTLAAVTVITREDIDNLQDQDLTELLDGLPGLTVTNSGGLGKTTGIRLRGTGTGHTLVIIDGVRIGSATLGETALQHLPLQQIERIEIVRGPVSHLYGADAVGGVIQIFTRKGGERLQVNIEAGYGSHDTSKTSLGISGSHNKTNFNLHVSQLKSDGISTLKDNNPDKDGYRNQSVTAQLGHHFSNNLELSINILHADGNTEYDSVWDAVSDLSTDFTQQSINGNIKYSPIEWWDTSLTLGETKDESSNSTPLSFFDTERRQASWQNNFFISDESTLTLGVDFLRDRIDSNTAYSKRKRDNTGVFIQYQITFGANDLTLALRHDDHDSFEDQNTGNIAWGYKLSERLQLSASYGTAFKAPSFNDLYYVDPWGFGSDGNPNLSPEKSKSIELGLKGKQRWGHWNLNAFRTSIKDLISWVETPPGSWIYQPQNVNSARIKGLEASISSTLAGWNIASNLTLLDPRDRTTGKQLVYRNKRTLRIDIDRTFGKTNIGATLQARSYSYKDTQNTQRASGFGTVDLRASHQLSANWKIKGEISNLFDKDYETIKDYNTEDRAIFVAIAYQSK